MAEFFFTAAWAAGIIEGRSVLGNAQKQESKNEAKQNSAALFVPSLLYGTAALPLGIIGASPGPSLVASFPFAPSISALESSSVAPTQPVSTNDDDTNSKAPHKTQEESSETLSLSDGTEEHEQPIISRSDMIRKVREDNRRSLAAKQQQHGPLPITQQRQPKPEIPSNITTTKLLSTLDGRPLATPLAEAMRRARFLFVGAGLVMSMASYVKSRQDEFEREEAERLKQKRRGRDVGAIQSLVEEGDSDDGVVVRLVDHQDALPDLTRSKGVVVPVVYRAENVNLHTSTDAAYWNLGTTPQEWKQTPLTKEWLLRSSENDGQGSLVVEADVSSSSLSDYLQDNFRPSTRRLTVSSRRPVTARRLQLYPFQPIDNALWASRILGMIAQQKGILDNDEAPVVNVIIGSCKRPAYLCDTNTIYINGPEAVGAKVWSILERMQPKTAETSGQEGSATSAEVSPAVKEESAPTQTDTTALKVPKSMNDAFSLLDYVGMKLREGGTRAATAVTNVFSSVFSKSDTKMVYALSDSPFAFPVKWLWRTMPYGWIIVGFDALNDAEAYHSAAAENEGVTFVCCKNDEATCATVCSLLMQDKAAARQIVVLVQEESCAATLRDLAAELNQETSVEIVSVKGVHSNLFEHARDLLTSGKTPSEVQESIDLVQ